jgi:DNA invertase Pin-like site-specific DNA recombinase
MFQIVGAMAERERSLIQEQVKAGLRKARRKGKTLGRPPRIIKVVEITRLREQGTSFREIAKAVGASPATVRTRLCNSKRMGRPPRRINVDKMMRMYEQGTVVRDIAKTVDVSPGTVSRHLMQQRLRIGLPNAKRGRPPRIINVDQMMRMREQGAGFREIAKAVGVSSGTVRARLLQLYKVLSQAAHTEHSPKVRGPQPPKHIDQ